MAFDADNMLLRVLLDPDGRADPYPLYRELRERAPVFRSAFGPVVLSRYGDCLEALRDPRLGRGVSARLRGDLPMTGGPLGFRIAPNDGDVARALFERASSSMLLADPPDHTRLRRLVSRAFTPQRVEALRPVVQRLADELFDNLSASGEVDFIETVALPLPVAVIGELVGVPGSDRAALGPLVDDAVAALDPAADGRAIEAGMLAHDEMRTYFGCLVEERRRRPEDDLLTGLVAARDAGDALDDDEIVGTAILLFAAGFETTTNLLGNGLLALLGNPDQLDRWRADPGLASSAVEELLRWDGPAQLNARTALVDAAIAGEHLEPGDVVVTLAGAANRDPTRFFDPDRLDLGRAEGQSLSFGWGIHHCLGAALARMEASVVLGSLFARFGAVELASDQPGRRPTIALRGLAALPIRLGP